LTERLLTVRDCGSRASRQVSYPGKSGWLLRLNGVAKRKEHNSKRKVKDFMLFNPKFKI
jgi:hypothetical protein